MSANAVLQSAWGALQTMLDINIVSLACCEEEDCGDALSYDDTTTQGRRRSNRALTIGHCAQNSVGEVL